MSAQEIWWQAYLSAAASPALNAHAQRRAEAICAKSEHYQDMGVLVAEALAELCRNFANASMDNYSPPVE